MSDFGARLRAARERRGVSLRDIAARTNFSIAALEALERNDPSRLAGGIKKKIKLASKGTREQRAQLIRDPNKLVAGAVLSSPKLTDAEVESFAKMANVAEEVLRVIGTNRTWLKNYGVTLGLVKNPKTPPAISMQLLQRINERDMKMLAVDRNVPEALRLAARKYIVKGLK
jgi:transcriptional regulator with XRE-family HTH domain